MNAKKPATGSPELDAKIDSLTSDQQIVLKVLMCNEKLRDCSIDWIAQLVPGLQSDDPFERLKAMMVVNSQTPNQLFKDRTITVPALDMYHISMVLNETVSLLDKNPQLETAKVREIVDGIGKLFQAGELKDTIDDLVKAGNLSADPNDPVPNAAADAGAGNDEECDCVVCREKRGEEVSDAEKFMAMLGTVVKLGDSFEEGRALAAKRIDPSEMPPDALAQMQSIIQGVENGTIDPASANGFYEFDATTKQLRKLNDPNEPAPTLH